MQRLYKLNYLFDCVCRIKEQKSQFKSYVKHTYFPISEGVSTYKL